MAFPSSILGSCRFKLSKDKTNLIPILVREDSDQYKVTYTEVRPEKIANLEKKIPQDWIKDKNILHKKIVNYALPLIEGEVNQKYKNGLPVFVRLDDFIL